jgi:taurine--2-oxoglutarate transaminase
MSTPPDRRRVASSPPPRSPRANASRFFYTWSAQRDAVPMEIVGGEGARFKTADGAEWLDFGSMVWNANLGHGHPGMRKALAEAAGRGLLVTPSTVFPDKTRAAELLLDVAPPGLAAGKVFFCLSGAEANENAIKIALQVTGRKKIIFRNRSYHGATLAMLSLSGDPRRAGFAPGYPHGVEWADPYSANPCPGDLESLLFSEDPETVAAVILEGVVGANGVYPPPVSYFRRIRQICDRYGVLFIADEVLSGFGRTGRWFAVDHDGVSPDLLTCAKAITGGYAPGGAVVASGRIARHFEEHTLSCGLTAYAHPLTCAAIVAAIGAYREEGLIPRAARLGEIVRWGLQTFARRQPVVREVRGLGLLWALELADKPGSDAPASPGRMKALAEALRRQRLHVHKRENLAFIAPPLVVTEADLDEGLARLGRAIEEVWGG